MTGIRCKRCGLIVAEPKITGCNHPQRTLVDNGDLVLVERGRAGILSGLFYWVVIDQRLPAQSVVVSCKTSDLVHVPLGMLRVKNGAPLGKIIPLSMEQAGQIIVEVARPTTIS